MRLNMLSVSEKIVSSLEKVSRPGSVEKALINLASGLASSERELLNNATPRYRAYTNIDLIKGYLKKGAGDGVDITLDRYKSCLAILVADWHQYERSALNVWSRGRTDEVGQGFHREAVQERVQLLCALDERLMPHWPRKLPSPEVAHAFGYSNDWLGYACHEDGALIVARLAALPQSDWHDEYLFLRTVQITEVCFEAILHAVEVALESHRCKIYYHGMAALRQANAVGDVLLQVMDVFRTMPTESFFDGFREATGDAGAVQSSTYQRLELLTRGLSERKRGVLGHVPEVKSMLEESAAEPNLKAVLDELTDGPWEMELAKEIMLLERTLMMWRSVHLGIAHRYLPAGTNESDGLGVSYLRSTLTTPRISAANSDQGVFSKAGLLTQSVAYALPFMDVQVGVILARGVDKNRLLECIDELATQCWERLKSPEVKQDVMAHIQGYNGAFSYFGLENPLPKQLDRVLRKGLPPSRESRLVLSLEFGHGMLCGLHDATRMNLPLHVTSAHHVSHFEGISGRTIATAPSELVFYDGRQIFATYVQGPDKRSAVSLDALTDHESDLLFLVMGSPYTPRSAFEQTMSEIRSIASLVARNHTDQVIALNPVRDENTTENETRSFS